MTENFETFYDVLVKNADERGSEPAAIGPGELVSHAEMLERVDRLAAGLTSVPLERGDRICILAQNSIQYLELYGACAKSGVVAYPINWRLSAEEVAAVVELADPRLLIVGSEHLPQTEALDAGQIYVVGDAVPEGARAFSELYSEAVQPASDIDPDEAFVIISTAAVAGVPRGAVLTHGNLFHAGGQLITALALTRRDRHLAALPLFHITGLGLSMATTTAGGANVVTPAFDPSLSAQMIDQHGVTLMADFPPVLELLMEARGEARWDTLRLVLGLDSPEMIQRLQTETNARFWTGFGQSETTGGVTLGPADERPGSAGKPLPLAEIRLENELGEEVPAGEVGEIAVRGPLVFAEYWQDSEATEFASRGGWHHTGDLGRFDEDGYLFYAGRQPEKELIKTGGENVYPAEVEQVLVDLEQVAAVCVIGVPNEKYGETVKAVVELEPGTKLSAEEVKQAVADRIASFKKPRQVEFVEALPRDPSGSIDREQVKAAHS